MEVKISVDFITPSLTLDRLPSEEAKKIDDAIDIVSQKFAQHDLSSTQNQFHLTTRTGIIDGVGLHHIGYGAPVSISSDPLQERHLLCLPLWGKAILQVGEGQWFCDSKQPMLLSPDREFRLHWLDSSPQLVVSIPNERIEWVSSAMFGDKSAVTDLPPTLSLSSAAGRSLSNELALAHDEMNSGRSEFFPEFLSRNVVDGLIGRILLAASSQLGGEEKPISSRVQSKLVSAVLDAISGSQMLEASPIQLARHLGVPLRTLQESIQNELGMSLSNVIRQSRLRVARSILLERDPTSCSVTEVALQCGFRHLGRFSLAYREAFGEKPSDTLRLLN